MKENKDLKKLSRKELLELFIAQSKVLEETEAELARAKDQLKHREFTVQDAGSIAEAALKLNGVFEAAQKAADQYVANVKLQVDGQMNQEEKEVDADE